MRVTAEGAREGGGVFETAAGWQRTDDEEDSGGGEPLLTLLLLTLLPVPRGSGCGPHTAAGQPRPPGQPPCQLQVAVSCTLMLRLAPAPRGG